MKPLILDKDKLNVDLICLGSQMRDLLNEIDKLNNELIWYVVDVYGTTKSKETLFPKNQVGVTFFESTQELIQVVDKIIQFETGVFIACLPNKPIKFNRENLPETEDVEKKFFNNSIIEIRTFDYSFFEIYSEEINFIKVLSKIKYNPPEN